MMQKVTIQAIFIWCLAILFFFYEFFNRVMPATISENIIHDLHISAEQFSLFGAAYYLTYSLMQTPVGIIYDRYGIRLFLTIASGLCTLGVFGFAYSDQFFSGFISRLLIGFGSSFGFISLLVLALNWFPQKYFAFLAGLGQMLGAVGPMMAGAPVAYLMERFNNNWKEIFLGVGVIGAVLTVLIALFVKTKPKGGEDEIVFLKKDPPLSLKLKQLMRISQVWWIMLYAGSVYVSLPLLGDYWGTFYLQKRGFDRQTAALIVSMIWIGLAIGSPLIGKLSDRFHRRKPFLVLVSFLGAIMSLAILYLPIENEWVLSTLFVCLGISASGQSLSFAKMADNVPEELRATAIGLNNTAVMLFAALLPPFVTWLMEEQSRKAVYDLADFQFGFLMMPFAFCASFLVSLLFIKETFCRQQHTVHYL